MPSILEIEKARCRLIRELSNTSSTRLKLLLVSDFFNDLLKSKSNSEQSYLIEFIEIYINCLHDYSPFFHNPEQTEKLLQQLCMLAEIPFLSLWRSNLESIKREISGRLTELKSILSGNEINIKTRGIIYFPVIEQNSLENSYGILETFVIEITKADKDEIIIIPSEAEIEARIQQQVNISLKLAVAYIKKFVRRPFKHHRVIIQFSNRFAFYIGDSLGTALTMGLIEKLFDLYNSAYSFHIKEQTAFTGGIDEKGNIESVSAKIIKEKTEIVFYSEAKLFVIPEKDKAAAEEALDELKNKFQNRKLVLIPAKNLADIIDRRSIVEIKKTNLLVRGAKKLQKSWTYLLVISFLLSIVGFYLIRDYDDNPAILKNDDNTLYVENKSGKVLWTRKLTPLSQWKKFESEEYWKRFRMLVDINNDGINEIIVCGEQDLIDRSKFGRIVCLDYKGNELWDYIFNDTISSSLGVLSPPYNIFIADTIQENNKRILQCYSTNTDSYSSALFKLDIRTGKRLVGTFWHQGFIVNVMISDIDYDGKKDVIVNGLNNGFEKAAVFVMDIEKLQGQSPSTKEYMFNNIPLSVFKTYVLLPNSDYSKYLKERMSSPVPGRILDYPAQGGILMTILENPLNYEGGILYTLKHNLVDFNIVIGSDLRVLRDTLVVQGKLSLPLTDTPEYCELLKSNILYWDGKKFVRREGLEKKHL